MANGFTALADREPQVEDQTDPKLIAELDAYYEASKLYKRQIAGEVLLNIAYFAGDQDIVLDSGSGRLRRTEPPWKSTTFTNLVKSGVTAFVAKMLRNKPGWRAAPGSNDDDDVYAAKGAEKLLDYYYIRGGFRAIVQDALVHAGLAGISWIKVVWDWTKGRSLDELDPEGQGVGLKEGDLSFENVDFFQGFPDPDQIRTGAPKQRFMIAHRMTRREIRERWPDRVDSLKFTPFTHEDQFGTVFQHAGSEGRYSAADATAGNPENEPFIVKEYWEMPSLKYPEGRLVHYAGDIVLDRAGFDSSRIPVFDVWHTKHPRRGWPVPMATELRQLNEEYNRSRRQHIEYNELFLRGAWIVPVGSGVGKDALIAKHGLRVDYRPVGYAKPEMMSLKPFPDQTAHLDRIIGDVQNATQVREITKGYAPPNVEAASALALLQEQDETNTAPIRYDLEDEIAKIGTFVLELIHTNMPFERKVEAIGETGEFEIIEFDSSKVRPWNVYVESGSMLPKSKYAAIQTAKELFQMGVIVDEAGMPDVRQFGKMLGGDFIRPEVFRKQRMDEQNAKREDKMMKQGMPVQVDPFDDDEIHVRCHELAQKTAKFSGNMEYLMRLEQHKREHLFALMRKLGGLAPGAGSGAPGTQPEAGSSSASNPVSPAGGPASTGTMSPEAGNRGSIQSEEVGTAFNRQSGGLG